MKYSLFYESEESKKEIDASVLQFVKLEKMLTIFLRNSSDTQKMLEAMRRKISYREFVMRRALFCDLENEASFKHFQKLYQQICEYDLYREKYFFFKGSKYKPLFFLKALSSFFDMIQSFISTKHTLYKSELMTALISECERIQNLPENKALLEEIQNIFNDFGNTHEACINLSRRDTHYKIAAPVTHETSQSILNDFKEILDLPDCVKPSVARIPEAVFEELFLKKDHCFMQVNAFFEKYKDCDLLDSTIDKDSFKFFIDMKNIFSELEEKGLPFCMPGINNDKELRLNRFYDVSLLAENDADAIVLNDFDYSNENNVFVVSGANGGGKTCFLRGICLASYLFSIGTYIPAAEGSLFPMPNIFAFFGVEESSDSGIFLQEKQFIENILPNIDENTILFLNEIMIGTGELKACRELGEITEKVTEKNACLFCTTHNYAYVDWAETHLKDITLLQPVLNKDSRQRTYLVQEVSVENCSHSQDILKKYALSKQDLEVNGEE